MQNDIWTYPVPSPVNDLDLEGFDVSATDGDIGKFDEASATSVRPIFIVATGPWIFGQKVLRRPG